MHPIREDEDEIFARLEARIESLTGIVGRLKDRNAELAGQLKQAEEDRAVMESALKESQQEASQLREEAATLRGRQKQAATRIKNLLSQVEQMDLLGEN
jgi:chromosome segregation ATPase